MDLTKEIQDTIALFNRLAVLLTTKRPTITRMSDNNIVHARDVVEFCRERGESVGAYLCSCFGKHSWSYCPKFPDLLVDRYVKYFVENKSAAYQWWAQVQREDRAQEPVDLPKGKEIVKRKMLAKGGAVLCRAQSRFTGGFNEHSPICRQCDLRESCE